MSGTFKTHEGVIERLEELYTKLMSGKEKHYIVKEGVNACGKVIGAEKNKLMYHAMRKQMPEIQFYEEGQKRLSRS